MTEETWPLALKEAITKVYGACTIMLATKEKLEQKYYDAGYRVSESGEVFILYNGESIARTTIHCPSVGPAITPARLQSYQKYGSKIYEEGMFVIHARGSHGAYKGVYLTDVNGTEVIAVHEPVTKPAAKRLPKRSDPAPLYTKTDTEQQTDDSTTVMMTVDEMIQYLKKQGYKVFKPKVEYVEI
jgi:hypothetical protein